MYITSLAICHQLCRHTYVHTHIHTYIHTHTLLYTFIHICVIFIYRFWILYFSQDVWFLGRGGGQITNRNLRVVDDEHYDSASSYVSLCATAVARWDAGFTNGQYRCYINHEQLWTVNQKKLSTLALNFLRSLLSLCLRVWCEWQLSQFFALGFVCVYVCFKIHQCKHGSSRIEAGKPRWELLKEKWCSQIIREGWVWA